MYGVLGFGLNLDDRHSSAGSTLLIVLFAGTGFLRDSGFREKVVTDSVWRISRIPRLAWKSCDGGVREKLIADCACVLSWILHFAAKSCDSAATMSQAGSGRITTCRASANEVESVLV